MPKLSLWNARKGNTYRFIDKKVSQQVYIGGTAFLVHKYTGPVEITDSGDATQPNYAALGGANELTIQDLFFLENRDRTYDENIYEMRGVYQVADQDFDLAQFGFFLPNDVIFVTLHLNDCVDLIGRKLMSGDVLEIPHLRDELMLDESRPAINKFYTVTDVNREAGGWSPLWWPHLLRVKLEPMTDSQEYADILDREASEGSDETLRDILSTYNDEITVSDAIQEAAEEEVPAWNFETAHFYIAPDDNGDFTDPWIFAGDGSPPNGAELLASGNTFPESPAEGDWVLRTDYTPHVLFRREGVCWVRKETDYRRKWKAAHRILETFINNDNITTFPDGSTADEKVALSKAVKPKVDL